MNNEDRNRIAKQHCNKLIAEFMGYEVKHNKCYSPKYKDGTIAPMQFDRSWDWLMPVVSKITRDEQYWEDDYREHLMDIVPYGHIEDTYSAVVGFIKEYNDGEQ
mgnify:CR=1 FL=1